MQTIQRAFREAFLALPAEEYDWFDIHSRARGSGSALRNLGTTEKLIAGVTEPENADGKQRQFFEFAGPLFTVAISPASSVVRVGEQRSLRALPYDRSRRRVETDLRFAWEVIAGGGALEHRHDQVATGKPQLDRFGVAAALSLICAVCNSSLRPRGSNIANSPQGNRSPVLSLS